MSATPAQSVPAAHAASARASAGPVGFVADTDASVRHFLTLVMHGVGLATEEFTDGHALLAATARRKPDIIFLNVGVDSSDASACVESLARAHYAGHIQVMSNRGSSVLAHVKGLGEQGGLQMLPALKKPFDSNVVLKTLQDLKLGEPQPVAGRIDLEEALRSNWIEFWYQPKIDLRRKQLFGVEVCARARHPRNGVMMPSAFLPGATEPSLVALSERALLNALQAGPRFAKLGVNLQLSTDIQVRALAKLDVAKIVKEHRPVADKWPGLIIELAEDQIVTDLGFAGAFAKQHQHLNVRLAIDDFGRAYSTLAAHKEMPFAQLKLGRAFVVDCGSEKTHAPLCRSVIELAHKFGSVAVAVGIEKAADALTLLGLGCDYGQGFLLGQPMPEDRFISLLQQRAGARAR
jgi:EAL domain-containing protein (putative c-di-GMP-specific phosphodiesterase class I)